ncbi:MAG: tetratricopeptide repeat protein [bacterium]|nr:tetratricopeptide repeat protein [bacterium]
MKIHRVLLFFTCIFAVAIVQAQQTPPQSGTIPRMNAEKWREDLRFLAERLPATHKNAFHKMTKADFESAVRSLDQRIPSLADHEVVVELMRIVAMVGDGHTGVLSAPFLLAPGVYPIQFYMFEDGLYVLKASSDLAAINGGKVVLIDGVPAAEIFRRVSDIVWRDNEQGIKDIGCWLLSSPRVLHALKVAKSIDKAEIVVLKDGAERTAEIRATAKPADLRNGSEALVDSRDGKILRPLWLKDPTNNFWLEHVQETKTLFVQFNAVQNKSNETVEAFFNRVFEYVEKTPTVEKLVIDLRMNGGGNNYLNLPLTLGAIKSRLNTKGHFFVIIGRETFSAAQNTVNELEKYTNAIFVGEPTAASPNHYGDAGPIELPNSKLQIRASTLWWQDADPRDTRKWKAPDVAADLTSDAYQNGRDPAMEAIVNYKPAMSFDTILADARATLDIATFARRLREFKANPAHRYFELETRVNNAGYFLLNQNRVDEAIEVFKLNVELHPTSANACDSLGEAFLKKGDKANALTNYRRALELDPKMQTAVEAVRTLTR